MKNYRLGNEMIYLQQKKQKSKATPGASKEMR